MRKLFRTASRGLALAALFFLLAVSLDLFSAPLCLMVAYLMLDEVFVHGPTGRGFGSAVSEASRDLR